MGFLGRGFFYVFNLKMNVVKIVREDAKMFENFWQHFKYFKIEPLKCFAREGVLILLYCSKQKSKLSLTS